MTVRVTKRDIEIGSRRTACGCPIAIAASRAYRVTCSVSPTELFATARGVPLPDVAREFVRRFDDGEYVEPFLFEVSK